MGLHHATLGAAVKKYGPLFTEGKSEEEIRAAIAGDEKAFEPEGIDEIFAAITADPGDDQPKEPKAKKVKGHIVKSEFRDKNDFAKLYKVGEDVSHFDEDRKADLVERGLIETV
jgi:hypothetical protein